MTLEATRITPSIQQWTIPGPPPKPKVGPRGNLLRFYDDPMGYLDSAFEKFGKIVSLVEGGGGLRVMMPGHLPALGVVSVYGPELTRQVETGHETYYKSALSGSLFPGDGIVPPRLEPLQRFGTGLFHVNSDTHRQHRRLLMPAFHKKRIESYHDDMVTLTEEALEDWRPGESCDLHEAMMHLTLRIATRTLFGSDLTDIGSDIGGALQQVLQLVFSPMVLMSQQDIPGTPYHQMIEMMTRIDTEIRQFIAHKRAAGCDEGDVLSMLVQARDEDGTTLTEDEIIGHAGVIFAAGHETSSNALTWTLLLLSQHPAILAVLVDELNGVLHGSAPTLDQLSQLPLLDRVVKESLRIIPPVPLNHRVVHAETELGGHTLPAGTELFVSIYHTHHMPELYPEPNRFNPARWETINPDPFEYNPFSAGPRMCIGAPFAQLEIKTVLAMLLQRYRMEIQHGAKVDPRFSLTLGPKNGLPVTIHTQDHHYTQGVGGLAGNIRHMVMLP